MRSDKKILGVFILNIIFSIVEIIGGILTNSISILSDAFHDMGDALGIGIAYYFEKISKKEGDKIYTYGYSRYSILGGVITTVILSVGSGFMIYNGIIRLFKPIEIDYKGMFIISIIGIVINGLAVHFTHKHDTLNEKAVNLHMIEDCLGWIVVLIGSIIIRYTGYYRLDAIMSIGIAIYILIHAYKNLKELLELFMERVPSNIDIDIVKKDIMGIDGVRDVHHIHIWSIDGGDNYCTMHVIGDSNIRKKIRDKVKKYNINHITIEIELDEDECISKRC